MVCFSRVPPRPRARGYAPATGPKLPEGWCGEKEGTLTRSTGECMCRYGCEVPAATPARV